MMTQQPACCTSQEDPSRNIRPLTIQLLNTAKACIPLCLKDTNTPTLSLRFSTVNNPRHMEDLIATLRNTEETFRETWRTWQYFILTDAYLH